MPITNNTKKLLFPILIIFIVGILFSFSAQEAWAVWEWMSPTGDYGIGWWSPSNARDGSISTWSAADYPGSSGWGDYLYLTHPEINCDGIRVYFEEVFNINGIEIDIKKNGIWENVYSAFQPSSNVWINVPNFNEGLVTEERVRVNFYSSNDELCLAELEFYGEILIDPPTITNSGGASNVTADSARLNGEITDTGGENSSAYFYWGDNNGGTIAGNWDYQAVIPDSPSQPQGAEAFYKDISGLISGTTYYYRGYASNSSGSAWADNTASFTYTEGLSCLVTSGTCSGTTVFKMYSADNSHAEIPSQTNYNYKVCCSHTEVADLGNSCVSDNHTVVLKLSEITNAHVEENSYSNYSNNVCLSAPAGYSIICGYSTDCSTLGTDYVCLASISGDTNAHVGDCSSYSTKVCCAVVSTGPSASTVITNEVTIGSTQLENSQATLNGNITNTGGENCDIRGFDWGTSSGSYPNNWTQSGSYDTGVFNYQITLTSGETIYYRAKAHNSSGWGYGDEKQVVIYTASGGQQLFETPSLGCVIGEVPYNDGDYNPSNKCEVCDISQSTTDWSNVSDGTDPNNWCNLTWNSCTGSGSPYKCERQGGDGNCYSGVCDTSHRTGNIASGYVCTGSGDQTVGSSTYYSSLSEYNGRSADKCDKKKDNLACDGSGGIAGPDVGDVLAYVVAYKIANSSGQEIDASLSDNTGTCHNCTAGDCSGTYHWEECDGSGNPGPCSVYNQSETVDASSGNVLQNDCSQTADSCGIKDCAEYNNYCSDNNLCAYFSCDKYCNGYGDCGDCTCEADCSSCGTRDCSIYADDCVGGLYYDYPDSCDNPCLTQVGDDVCDTCGCDEDITFCAAGGCCEISCTDSSGCYTTAGTCSDSCGINTLNINRTCSGCGANGAIGSCGGGINYTCNSSSHSECQFISCGGATYYCTQDGEIWEWRISSDPDRCGGNLDDSCHNYDSGCEIRDYYCSAGSCVYSFSDRYTDTACSYTGCATDKCTKTGTYNDYFCDNGCIAHSTNCSEDCSSTTACESGVCSSVNLCDSTLRDSLGEGDNNYNIGGDYLCQGTCDNLGNCDYAVNCEFKDIIPPTVGEIYPTSATVNVSTNFSADVSDNVKIISCSLYIEGVNNGDMSLSLTPCQNCTASKNHTFTLTGDYSLYSFCTDEAGNSNFGPPVTVSVTSGLSCDVNVPDTGVINQSIDINVSNSYGAITQVRFNPEGTWTSWYDWDTSEGDWNDDTKIIKMSFTNAGTYNIQAEIKDSYGFTDSDSDIINIFECYVGEEKTCSSIQNCSHTIICQLNNTWPSCPEDICISYTQNDPDCLCSGIDVCIRTDYYDYPEYGDCNSSCSCNTSMATGQPCAPDISYNDPRCTFCGDGNCDTEETTWNCCQDCGLLPDSWCDNANIRHYYVCETGYDLTEYIEDCGSDEWIDNYQCSVDNRWLQRQYCYQDCESSSCPDSSCSYLDWQDCDDFDGCHGLDYWDYSCLGTACTYEVLSDDERCSGLTYCGDGNCDTEETVWNCCQDCGNPEPDCKNNLKYWYICETGYNPTQYTQDCGSDEWTDNYSCSIDGRYKQREYHYQGCEEASCYEDYNWLNWQDCDSLDGCHDSDYWNYSCSVGVCVADISYNDFNCTHGGFDHDQCNSDEDCNDGNSCTTNWCENPAADNSVCQLDGLGHLNPDEGSSCGICKVCDGEGNCVNINEGENDCGTGCQRCAYGFCQDYNSVCAGTLESCECISDDCTNCSDYDGDCGYQGVCHCGPLEKPIWSCNNYQCQCICQKDLSCEGELGEYPDVYITPTSQEGVAGSVLTYTVWVINKTSDSADFSLDIEEDCGITGWSCNLNDDTLTILSGQSKSTSLTVHSPVGASKEDYDISVTATNNSSGLQGTGYVIYKILNNIPTVSGLSSNLQVLCNYIYPYVELSWNFNDIDEDEQSAYEVEIFSDPGCNNLVNRSNDPDLTHPDAHFETSSNWYNPGPPFLSFNTDYYWKVRVWDDQGAISDWSEPSSFRTPIHAAPRPIFELSTTHPSLNETIEFQDNSVCYIIPNNDTVGCESPLENINYEWNFGDEETSSTQGTVSHTYSDSEQYNITLSITDNSFLTDPIIGHSINCTSDLQVINVTQPLPQWQEIAPF